MEWQALPQRRRKARTISVAANDEQSASSNEESNPDIEDRGITANEAKVDANIAARKKIKRGAAPLEGQDGCAGEFYECKQLKIV